jgi:hypothetical protein
MQRCGARNSFFRKGVAAYMAPSQEDTKVWCKKWLLERGVVEIRHVGPASKNAGLITCL